MTAPSLRARARSTGPRTSSTATAPARSRTRSATAGCSPPTPRTCPRRRCSGAPRRRWPGPSDLTVCSGALERTVALRQTARLHTEEGEMAERGNAPARYLARGLALVLIAGGLLAAFGQNGFARMLRGADGYASFQGYVPEKCVTATQYARAINGDVIRVCQHVYNLTYAFFAGHDWRPLGDSDTTLHVALPDAGRHFSWFDPTEQSDWFEPATLDPVVPGNPAGGAAHFSAVAGATKYLDVTQTAKVAAGASAYTLTWAITNRAATAQRIRPMVATTGF